MTKTAALILTGTIVTLLVAPLLIIGYSIVLGAHFSGDQLSAATILAVAGVFSGYVSVMIISEVY